jgi:hypothetical protein
MDTLQRQQRRLRWLTVTAVVLWSLAVLTSAGVLVFYTVFYAPKERQILDDYGAYGHLRERSAQMTESEAAASRPPTPGEKALGLQFTMSWVMMKVVLFVAVSVIILSCGTLATLLARNLQPPRDAAADQSQPRANLAATESPPGLPGDAISELYPGTLRRIEGGCPPCACCQ